jgi:hypothetical protein
MNSISFLRKHLEDYVISEGYLAYACMASDLIFNLTRKELKKRFPTIQLEGIHTGSFRILASFQTINLSIYDPVVLNMNFYPCEPTGIDPNEIYLFLNELFQKKDTFEEITSNDWIHYSRFSSPNFLFSSSMRTFGGIRYQVIPSISKQSISSVFPWYPEMKIYQNPIEDFSPYSAYSFLEVDRSGDTPILEWKKELSFAFLVWFENETRDAFNSFNRCYENVSYSYRPFRTAVVVLIYLKMHLLIYANDLYKEDTLLLLTFLCGTTFSKGIQSKNMRSRSYSPFSSFVNFSEEVKFQIKKTQDLNGDSIWWLSHPCDESFNLLETWNKDETLSSKFFQWIALIDEQFSETSQQSISESPEDYLKRVFIPILRNSID